MGVSGGGGGGIRRKNNQPSVVADVVVELLTVNWVSLTAASCGCP